MDPRAQWTYHVSECTKILTCYGNDEDRIPAEEWVDFDEHLAAATYWKGRTLNRNGIDQPVHLHDGDATGGRTGDGRKATGEPDHATKDRLAKVESVTDWLAAQGHVDEETRHADLDRYLKGMALGDW